MSQDTQSSAGEKIELIAILRACGNASESWGAGLGISREVGNSLTGGSRKTAACLLPPFLKWRNGGKMKTITRIITAEITTIEPLNEDVALMDERQTGNVIKEGLGVDDVNVLKVQDFIMEEQR